jgi:hypothetical protein
MQLITSLVLKTEQKRTETSFIVFVLLPLLDHCMLYTLDNDLPSFSSMTQIALLLCSLTGLRKQQLRSGVSLTQRRSTRQLTVGIGDRVNRSIRRPLSRT